MITCVLFGHKKILVDYPRLKTIECRRCGKRLKFIWQPKDFSIQTYASDALSSELKLLSDKFSASRKKS
ncbi:MAG: hypothetical protein DRQ88_05905 [Epsilonproteobacteria bacterium]|nr:MAG: hypothetical protein DRQ88_05905 [Campylobacterota bacterium]